MADPTKPTPTEVRLRLDHSRAWDDQLARMRQGEEAQREQLAALRQAASALPRLRDRVREGVETRHPRGRALHAEARRGWQIQVLRHALIRGASPVLSFGEWLWFLCKLGLLLVAVGGLVLGAVLLLLKLVGAL